MNLALPAIITILGILPGIVFFNSYFSGRFQRALAGISSTSELALYILFAIPLNLLALPILNVAGLRPDFPLIARLLTASSDAVTAQLLADRLSTTGAWPPLVYCLVLLISLLLGNLIRRLVWAFRLDLHFPFLRMKHEWYYTLLGRLSEVPRGAYPYADILVKAPEGSKLYQGLVVAVEISKDGKIEQLVLAQAKRGSGRSTDFTWKDIPGERFILTGDCIHTINMRYVVIVKRSATPPRTWQRLREQGLVIWRSFIYQKDVGARTEYEAKP